MKTLNMKMDGVVELYNTDVVISMISTDELISNYYKKEKFTELCKACSNYNVLWSCPPLNFDPEGYIKNYKNAYVIGTKIIYSHDTIDHADTKEKVIEYTKNSLYVLRRKLLNILWQLEKEYPSSIGMSSGGCEICSRCRRTDDLSCSHPDMMRYSLEALGIDLSDLSSHLLNIELKWSDGKRLPEYYTVINAFLTNAELNNLQEEVTGMLTNKAFN